MKRQQNSSVLPWALLTIPVLWMGAVLAYGYEDGMNVIELLGALRRFGGAPLLYPMDSAYLEIYVSVSGYLWVRPGALFALPPFAWLISLIPRVGPKLT